MASAAGGRGGVAQDCTDVSIDEKSSRVIATRPVYGGSAVAKFQFNQDDPQVIIIRAKAFEPLKPDNSRQGSIEKLDIEIDDSAIQLNIIETVKEEKNKGHRKELALIPTLYMPVICYPKRNQCNKKYFCHVKPHLLFEDCSSIIDSPA